jgi:hypothetical protein
MFEQKITARDIMTSPVCTVQPIDRVKTVIGSKVSRHAYCHPERSEGSKRSRFFAKSALSDEPRFFAEFTLSEANVLRMTGRGGRLSCPWARYRRMRYCPGRSAVRA